MAECTFAPELFTRRACSTSQAVVANTSGLHSLASCSRERQVQEKEYDKRGSSNSSNRSSSHSNNYIVPNFDQPPRVLSADQYVYRHHRDTRGQSQRIDDNRVIDTEVTRECSSDHHGNSRVSYPEFIGGHGRNVEELESKDGVGVAMAGCQEERRRHGALPEGWSMFVASEGRLYFFNAVTGAVQWERPTAECR